MSRPFDYADATTSGAASTSLGTGVGGWLRWFWRQLTSMRVALILLLMLALAAIPGSLVPQRGADPNGVIQFERDHPKLFPVLDAFPIQAFDVYSSVWFSAIYLLLFISLIGCILPRIRHHYDALRRRPPRTPARLQRMAGYAEVRITNPAATAAEKLAYAERAIAEGQRLLRGHRYRTVVETIERRGAGGEVTPEVSVSAERGYLRETGNLLFHAGLVGVLISVAIGGSTQFNGQKVLVEGDTMINSYIDYDTVTTGRFFHDDSLEPYAVKLNKLKVDYVTPDNGNVNAIGMVTQYHAHVTLIDGPHERSRHVIRVNYPLRAHGAPIYLVQNGYAPKLTVRNHAGEVVFSEAVPFIPQDGNMTSLGVVKIPHGLGKQVGLRGFFYPTKADLDTGAYTSNYPDLENPLLTLDVFAGDLGMNRGIPQSVYELDTRKMTQLTGRAVKKDSLKLKVGETVELPDQLGTITLDKVPRYASFEVMRNPAQNWILASALVSLFALMLSLFIPRRRVWIKAVPSADGVVLQYAALARGDDPSLEQAVQALRDEHRERL